MLVSVWHSMVYRYASDVARSTQYIRLRPCMSAYQKVFDWVIHLPGASVKMHDAFDNLTEVLTLDCPHREIRLLVQGRVQLADAIGGEPAGQVNPRVFLRSTDLTMADWAVRDWITGLNLAPCLNPSEVLAQLLSRVREHIVLMPMSAMLALDPSISPILELIESAAIATHEAASALNAYADRVDLDPERLAHVEQRISSLFAAGRKLRLPPERLPDMLAHWQKTLGDLPRTENLKELTEHVAQYEADYRTSARILTQQRSAAAAELGRRASASIAALGMPGAHLEIAVEPDEPTVFGVDCVEFKMAGHAGVAPRPLSKVASGGELSRVSLAISALAAQNNPVSTLIFDEADAGVGGAVAEVIGALMRELGQTRQVFCVTHLPQVAAQAHAHYQVVKRQVNGQIISTISQLDPKQRVEEIARMLGGVAITATTLQHAREMLR